MEGTTAVITGASRGIGAATARLFAEEGAHVAVCARSADELDAVVSDIEAAGATATGQRADVRDEYDVRRFVAAAARDGDGIDVLFANAGVYHGPPGETPMPAESYGAFDDHLGINARGVFATIREATEYLTDDARVLVPSGSIANDPKPGYGTYAVSKAAAEAIAAGFAAELDQVVGVLDPGQVSTALTNDAPGRDPEEIAKMVRWAAVEADPETVDGERVDLRTWRGATR